MTLSIMTLNITTFITMTLSIMALGIVALIILAIIITTHRQNFVLLGLNEADTLKFNICGKVFIQNNILMVNIFQMVVIITNEIETGSGLGIEEGLITK
jgi:hypothetical protein